VFILRLFPTGSLGFWLGVHYRRGGRFCCFAGFFEAIRLKMSDEGDIWGDPKGKSISRGEKRRMEAEARGPRFQGPRGLLMMELNQARNVRPLFSKHYTSGSKKFLL
jgi:hypothetical protein